MKIRHIQQKSIVCNLSLVTIKHFGEMVYTLFKFSSLFLVNIKKSHLSLLHSTFWYSLTT